MAPTDGASAVLVRAMTPGDVTEALALMRELARIEGYLAQFAVTQQTLLTHGFGPVANFQAFVAQAGAEGEQRGLLGLAVTYLIPWTYDLRPTVVLKELVVAEGARSKGVGEALLAHVARYALERGAARVLWTVLEDNHAAQRFYRRCAAQRDEQWQNWALDESAMRALAQSDR